jgi:hypothetical protein
MPKELVQRAAGLYSSIIISASKPEKGLQSPSNATKVIIQNAIIVVVNYKRHHL